MYLTVKEASDLTGKSATTIYRLCNKRRNSLYIKKEDNKFFIDKDFLLATYPLEEKRTEDIIENGSKEIGEPVFLEIEPKIEEEIKLVRDEEEKVFKLDEKGDLIIENLIENNKKSVVTNPKPEKKEILLSGALPEGQNSETELPENQKVPFYKSKEFLEQFIGLSVIAIVLASLLLLLYYNLN